MLHIPVVRRARIISGIWEPRRLNTVHSRCVCVRGVTINRKKWKRYKNNHREKPFCLAFSLNHQPRAPESFLFKYVTINMENTQGVPRKTPCDKLIMTIFYLLWSGWVSRGPDGLFRLVTDVHWKMYPQSNRLLLQKSTSAVPDLLLFLYQLKDS